MKLLYSKNTCKQGFGKLMLRLGLVLLLLFSTPASARMYQWVDPDSGSTQLSGKPPTWYRSDKGGPRIFVFEKSRLIDDTGIAVADGEREKLRQRAFLQADEDRERARAKLLEAKRLDAALKQKQSALVEGEEEELPMTDEPVEDIVSEPRSPDEPVTTVDQMRKLIEEWEKAQTEKARGVLEDAPAAPR